MENKRIISPFDTENKKSENSLWCSFVQYKESKIKKFNKDYQSDLNNYISTINKISPLLDTENNNILLYGMIQSGKTDFIIGLISNYFSRNESVIALSINQNNNDLLKQTINRTKLIIDNNVYKAKDIKNSKNEIISKIKNKENIVIFSLKEKNNLENVRKLIDELQGINFKIIILDDEGDSASFTDCKKEEFTTIHRLITTIKEKTKSPYISITATPFANIMVSKDDLLKPNYGFFLRPSSGYVGIDYFVNDYLSSTNSSFVEIEEIKKEEIDELSLNIDFVKAIKFYLVQSFKWNKILNKKEKPRMLINIRKEKPSHIEIEQKIFKSLLKIKQNIDYLIPIDDVFNHLSINLKYKQEFYEDLDEIIKNIKVSILHGNNEIDANLDDHEYIYSRIIIGHTKLDRGLTIIDLVNMFFSSRSIVHPNADLILQQARFLGYRDAYKEDTRIFLTKNLISDYIEISNSSQFFKSILDENSDFNKINNFVPLSNHNNLFPTRGSVADYKYIDESSKYDLIANKYYDSENDLDIMNNDFYEKFSKIDNLELDSLNNPYIKLEGWVDFANTFKIKQTHDEIRKYLYSLININDKNDLNYINQLESNSGNIYVRLIRENYRKIYFNQIGNYYNIGKGNYCSNEFEFQLKPNSISIDIIPLNIYNEDRSISKKIYRARIFLDKNKISRKGYVS